MQKERLSCKFYTEIRNFFDLHKREAMQESEEEKIEHELVDYCIRSMCTCAKLDFRE